jgi:hypothetical protein
MIAYKYGIRFCAEGRVPEVVEASLQGQTVVYVGKDFTLLPRISVSMLWEDLEWPFYLLQIQQPCSAPPHIANGFECYSFYNWLQQSPEL